MSNSQSTPWQSEHEETEAWESPAGSPNHGMSVNCVVGLHFEKILQFGFKARWRGNGSVSYLVEVYRNSEFERRKDLVDSEYFTLVGCRPSSEYKVVVRPRNRHGVICGLSKSRIFWTDPTPIHGLRIKEDKGKIILSWNEPQEDNIEYEIDWYEEDWWSGWKRLGRESIKVSSFWINSPTPGKRYRFTIQAKNSYRLFGEKKEIYKTCTGKYTVKFCIVKKETNNVSVLYDLDEERLNSTLQNWLQCGYVRIHPDTPPVIMYSSRNYKSKLHCESRSVQISPEGGHDFEDQLLFDGDHIRYSFVTKITERGSYVFEFKLEEDGKVIKTEPFQIDFAGSEPLTRNVQGGVACFDDATVNVNMNGGAFNVNPDQLHGHVNQAPQGEVPDHPIRPEGIDNHVPASTTYAQRANARRDGYKQMP